MSAYIQRYDLHYLGLSPLVGIESPMG